MVMWWCGGLFVVVVWWCQHPARELTFFGVLQDCGDVVVWWCFCGGVVVSLLSDVLRCAVEMCICVRCVMCGNSRQQLADTKDALVRGITTL